MAIILGGNGVDAAVTIGPNIVTDGLVFYIDPADTTSLVPKDNAPLGSGIEIDYIHGLVGDTQKIAFSTTTFPYYSPTKQGYLTIGLNNLDICVGDLSKEIVLGSTYTVDIWIAPRVDSSNGANWLTGKDSLRASTTSDRVLLSVSKNGISTYGYGTLSRSIVQDQWINITIVVTPTQATYYTNGVFRGVGLYSITPIDMTLQYIGIFRNKSTGGDGNIGPTKAYDRALTAQEVKQNYNAIKNRYTI